MKSVITNCDKGIGVTLTVKHTCGHINNFYFEKEYFALRGKDFYEKHPCAKCLFADIYKQPRYPLSEIESLINTIDTLSDNKWYLLGLYFISVLFGGFGGPANIAVNVGFIGYTYLILFIHKVPLITLFIDKFIHFSSNYVKSIGRNEIDSNLLEWNKIRKN